MRPTRDELSSALASKQDRAEARGLQAAHEALQAAVVGAESKAQQVH